jgi:hypothetical protein
MRQWKEVGKKSGLLPVLTRTEGGLVIFTQFLGTQTALAGKLAQNGVKTWILNGRIPAPQRQGIVEPAFGVRVSWQHGRDERTASALFVPRTRRWHLREER